MYTIVAVLTSGWPFCVCVFMPFIVQMSLSCLYVETVRIVSETDSGLVCHWVCAKATVMYIDYYYYYGRLVSPTWNILYYNVLSKILSPGSSSGNGDELYGVWKMPLII